MRPCLLIAFACLVGVVPGTASGCGSSATAAEEPGKQTGGAGWLKGQLHAHTTASGDGKLSIGMVVQLYRSRGYDFVVLTDHNRVARVSGSPGLLVLPGVELTMNLDNCDPPPLPGSTCALHVNALLIEPERVNLTAFNRTLLFPANAPPKRVEVYRRGFREALRMGGIPQLNHPNLRYGAAAEILFGLAQEGLRLFELANEGEENQNAGDAGHPSTEALWDAALGRGAHVYATASDDLHQEAELDRGFVMVHAERNAASIRAALLKGDFYASTGVILDRVELGVEKVEVTQAADQPPATFEAIGPGGRVVQKAVGAGLQLDPRSARTPFLRVRVTRGPQKAWTQPVWMP